MFDREVFLKVNTSFRFYRLYITKAFNSQYNTVDSFSLYETSDKSSPDIALGSITTASSLYGSSLAKNATDGASGTSWSSLQGTSWLMVDLMTPRTVRSFSVTGTSATERPKDFEIQGSNNGDDWEVIYRVTSNEGNTVSTAISINAYGVSTIDTGESSLYVLVFDFHTGVLLSKVIPSVDGSWGIRLDNNNPILVTHVGASGYEPKSDGPIAPYSW